MLRTSNFSRFAALTGAIIALLAFFSYVNNPKDNPMLADSPALEQSRR